METATVPLLCVFMLGKEKTDNFAPQQSHAVLDSEVALGLESICAFIGSLKIAPVSDHVVWDCEVQEK